MAAARDLSGVVLVAKPAGPTSHDIVDVVRRVLGIARIGHLGTLDPFATGLLVLVVGRATRLAPCAAAWSKEYTGVIRLGSRTTTDDATGTTIASSEAWRGLDRTAVTRALERFEGVHEQEPPAFSAVHVNGERAYRRARRGEPITIPSRQVEIRELRLTGLALPDIEFRALVAAGTYLRSLARDVGAALGCGAHLARLERQAVGPFRLEDAVLPEAVTPATLRDPATLAGSLARRELSAAERAQVLHGRAVSIDGAAAGETDAPVALFAGAELVAIAVREGELLKPRVVVAEP